MRYRTTLLSYLVSYGRAAALLLTALLPNRSGAQTAMDTAKQAQIKDDYRLALQYKNGTGGVAMDYGMAYNYFSEAAVLGDAQSVYALAYMRYKGLGCEQNYDTAAALFAQGAELGRDNSLYFYGLCWRNGYGRPKNEDSARFYLQKSAELGYRQAVLELATSTAENSDDSAAQVVLQQINNAAIPNSTVLNQFNRVQPHLPPVDVIGGEYKGWLIQYDWSGAHIVSAKKLQVILTASDGEVTGKWIEASTDTAKLKAAMVSDTLLFEETKYARTDHYSLSNPVPYNFESARLNIQQQGDSVFITGNVNMFSSTRGEPSKPLFAVLGRAVLKTQDSIVQFQWTAYPNPFTSVLNVQFTLPGTANVGVQLYNLSGALLYDNEAGTLEAGEYNLPVYNLDIVPGVYILKMLYNNQSKTAKVIKQ